MKMLSVIIPTCHRNEMLAQCLDRLKPGVQTIEVSLYEVIVTDDGSQSSAQAMLEDSYPWVKWVPGPKKGPAANRNNGARQAIGEWLIFFDDDCLPNANVLEVYQKAVIDNNGIGVLEGRIYTDRLRQRLDEDSPVNETGGYLWSCNFAIKRDLFYKIGAFDERFPYAAMEDAELHYRLKLQGIYPKFVAEAAVCHPWRKNSDIIKRCLKKEKSLMIYLDIHPQERNKFSFAHFMWLFVRSIVKSYIPGLFRYRFKGALSEGLRIAYFLRFSIITLRLKINEQVDTGYSSGR